MPRTIRMLGEDSGSYIVSCFQAFCFVVIVPLLFLSCKPKIEQMNKWNAEDAPCNTTFIIHDSYNYWMYRWEPHHLTLLYSGRYHSGARKIQSAYNCDKNEIINTVQRLSQPFIWDLKRIQGDGVKKDVTVPDGPKFFEQYHDRLLIDTAIVKMQGEEEPSMEEVVKNGDQRAYLDILDYNLTTGKIEARYPYGHMNFMFRVGENLYIGSGFGRLVRINLDTKKETEIYSPAVRLWYPEFAVTRDGRAFMLYYPRYCVPDPDNDCSDIDAENRAVPLKVNTLYEVTSGKAVEMLTLKYPDTVRMLGVEKYLYIFTGDSQVAVQYNTENKTLVEHNFPFRYLTNINYLAKSFVLCYTPKGDPSKGDSRVFDIPCLVTDDTFKNSTKPIIVPIFPAGIATAYRNSGGMHGPM